MIKRFMDLFKKPIPHVGFKSIFGNYAVSTAVVTSRSTKPKWDAEFGTANTRYTICPGLHDFAMHGYLVRAHSNIHIKANKAGCVVKVDGPQESPQLEQTFPFDEKLVTGWAPIDDTVKPVVLKLPLPWGVFTDPGYSGFALPALMHFPHFDKIWIYPGIVDYDKFHVINLVFSPITECEFTITTNTPLMQVIPFKREDISASCDRATPQELDKYKYTIPTGRIPNFYKKFLRGRKRFTMSCPFSGGNKNE